MNHELQSRGLLRITSPAELRAGRANESDCYIVHAGVTLVFYPAQDYLPEYLRVVVEEKGRLPLTCFLPTPGVLALLRTEANQAIRVLRTIRSGTLSSSKTQLEAYSPLVALEMTALFLLRPEIQSKLEPGHRRKLRRLKKRVENWQAKSNQP